MLVLLPEWIAVGVVYLWAQARASADARIPLHFGLRWGNFIPRNAALGIYAALQILVGVALLPIGGSVTSVFMVAFLVAFEVLAVGHAE